MSEQESHFFEFGPFRADIKERLLYRDGEVVPLSPKVFETLLVLIERRGHVLEKAELMEILWPDSFVEESSLSQNISRLRKALGEGGAAERHYIETLPKRGYRFVACVTEVRHADTESAPRPLSSAETLVADEKSIPARDDAPVLDATAAAAAPSKPCVAHRTWRSYVTFACILLISATTFLLFARACERRPARTGLQAKSIAVLPFKTLGADGETEILGLGMADALIIKLSKLPQPSVLPTGSIFKYTKRDKDALSIGRELGVDAVLDGTVQRAGDRVRITAQLIKLSDEKVIWSGTFDEQCSGIFALQDSLSEQLAVALTSELTNRDRERLAGHLTQNVEAYQDYLMGVYFWNRRTEENLVKAIGYLERAVGKDANFAMAHAVLADCYYLSGINNYKIMSRSEAIGKAHESARSALALDERLAEAHTTMAGIRSYHRDYEAAEKEFRRAIELNPNYSLAHVRYGYLLFGLLQLENAVSEMKRARELDPASPITNAALAYMLRVARDYDGAIRYNRIALELQEDIMGARAGIAESYIHKGMPQEALAEIEKLGETDPLLALQLKAYAFAVSGRQAEAAAIVSNLQQSKDHHAVPAYNYALIYANLGDKDRAFEWLKKDSLLDAREAMLKFDPEMDPLRNDPRYAEMLKAPLKERPSN
ncbi:MAG TPA: winged helix-turn-helix domain-containing protein [Pyrinomonadaceae bacterium]|nr:winged helix-turn-helix domain-containing protein [Pyrinomonadaceae bacterium]